MAINLIIVLLAMALTGWAATAGHAVGVRDGRAEVANECRQSGGFAVKRTGFACEVKRR